ncbi:MAG: PAS domain-containing protein [Singulisphaera sp.]
MREGQPEEDSLRDALAFARCIIDTVREPFVILDEHLRVHRVNRSFHETFGASPPETEGRLIYELGNGQWDIPGLRTRLDDLLNRASTLEDFEVELDIEGVGRKSMLLNARRLDHDGKKILLAIEDITERRRAERIMGESRRRLVESDRSFAETLNALSSHIAILDERGVILHVNAAWRRFAAENGLKDDDRRRPGIPRGLHRATTAASRTAGSARASGHPGTGGRLHRRVSLPLSDRRPLVRDAGQSRHRAVGPRRLSHDLITERVIAETGLRKSEARAHAILESITDAFFALDREWRFTYVNPQAERILGRTSRDLIGKVIWVEYPGLAGSEFERPYHRAATDGVASTVTSFYPDHDRWYEVRTYPAGDGVSVYFRDVSERVQAEQDLRKSEAWLQTVTDTLPALVGYIGRDLRYRFVNRSCEEWFGATAGQLVGKSMREVLGDAAFEQRGPYLDAVRRGEEVRFEGPTEHIRLGPRQTEIVYRPHLEGGEVAGFLSTSWISPSGGRPKSPASERGTIGPCSTRSMKGSASPR